MPRIGFADTLITSLDSKNALVFAGTSFGLFISENNGIKWTPINDGMEDKSVSSFAVNNDFVFFARGWLGGTWRRAMSEMPTEVTFSKDFSPIRFNLDQNYPNPFNPSTVITYQLPQNEYVALKSTIHVEEKSKH